MQLVMAGVAVSMGPICVWSEHINDKGTRNIAFVTTCAVFIAMWVLGSAAEGIAAFLVGTALMAMAMGMLVLVAISFSCPVGSRLSHAHYYSTASRYVCYAYLSVVWSAWWVGSTSVMYLLMKDATFR